MPNRRTDPMTFHGGCPVLVGSKWITNKWIHSYGQMFNFPCKLEANLMKRMPSINNDVCKMTDNCENMDIYKKYWTYEHMMMNTTYLPESME